MKCDRSLSDTNPITKNEKVKEKKPPKTRSVCVKVKKLSMDDIMEIKKR